MSVILCARASGCVSVSVCIYKLLTRICVSCVCLCLRVILSVYLPL
jgi:hypothetical protein